ncbi:DinB family protein [Nocardioides pantholopis]|uniref:DinB family protein n=1 Tax=Nocardioides pantholopis TaxID=2483798 RepID=UPI000F073074|nr:DinB family protein [Nocardioides pantholopis]
MTDSETQTRGTPDPAVSLNDERSVLLEALRQHRTLFRVTVQGLDDDQARLRPTASELSLGGLIKHVCAVEAEWARFVVEGPADGPGVDWANIDWSNPPAEVVAHQDGFIMREDETLPGLLAAYDEVAAATDALVASVDLDTRWPLPEAPWFESGKSWSARRAFLHIVAETAQHAGHADILRETLDGQKTMG